MGLGPGAVTAVGLGRIPGTARRRLLRAVPGLGLGAVPGLGAARRRVPTRHGHPRHEPPVLRPRLGFAAPRGGSGARSGTGLGERPAVIAAGPQGAGPAEGQRAGGGHGALAEGAAVRGAAQSGRRGSLLQQGGREPCLRLPGRAQLPGPAGAVPGLPHGARHRPVRGRVPRLPRGACPGGSRAETSAGGAPAPASGASGGWEWPAPPQSYSGSSLAEFGIACHLGVLTDLPCIGVAKNLLHVDGLVRDELHKEQVRSLQRSGEAFPLTGTSGKVLGMVLRSHSNSSRPLYVSVGHRVSLGTAVSLVRACCRFRIPEPIRQADIRSREYLRRQPCAPVEGLQAVPAGPQSKKEAESED